MPQFIAAAALAIANAAQVAVVAAGLTTTAAAFVGTALYSAVSISIYIGIASVAAKVLAPSLPRPGSTQVPLRQSVQPRRSGFGFIRTSGLYSLFEAVEKLSVDVLAIHDGRINAWVRWYLNDDRVELTGNAVISPDGVKYASDGGSTPRVWIYNRLGLDTETYYAEIAAIYAGWTSAHRGDGIASLALKCQQTKAKHMSEDYPNGLPLLSAAYEAQLIYDPRDGAQTQGDKSTYVYSDNPVLCLLAYMTDANGGMGLDYNTRFLPEIGSWIAAADDCDADEVTSTGTEKRYRCSGAYDHDNAPADVIRTILDSFDGWLAQVGSGAFRLHSGRYYAPTVTIEDKHVLSYSLTHFTPDEQAVNEYVPMFTDPDSEFTEVDAGAVQDEPDIAARGVLRSQKLPLLWVPSASQAVRIARRMLDRQTQELRGSITTNLYGLNALGERYLQLEIEDNAALADLVVEVTGPAQIDLANLSITFPFVAANATIDDGDPGGDVDPPGVPDPRPGQDPLDPPVIDTLTAIYDDSGAGIAGARISADVTPPAIAEAEAQWKLRWRKAGDANWTEGAYDDIDDGASVTLVTGFVAATGTIEVQVAYQLAAATSPWSATESIVLATPSILSTTITASEDLAAGNLVNVWNSSGAKVRKADATTAGKEAHGFVKAAVTSGQPATVYFEGTVTRPVLTPGPYFLSTTAGGVTATAPSASGNVVQPIGVATSTTEIDFEAGQSVELA